MIQPGLFDEVVTVSFENAPSPNDSSGSVTVSGVQSSDPDDRGRTFSPASKREFNRLLKSVCEKERKGMVLSPEKVRSLDDETRRRMRDFFIKRSTVDGLVEESFLDDDDPTRLASLGFLYWFRSGPHTFLATGDAWAQHVGIEGMLARMSESELIEFAVRWADMERERSARNARAYGGRQTPPAENATPPARFGGGVARALREGR